MLLPLIGLIPLLPLAGFVVCGLLGKRLPKPVVTGVACGSVLLAFLVSLGAALELRTVRRPQPWDAEPHMASAFGVVRASNVPAASNDSASMQAPAGESGPRYASVPREPARAQAQGHELSAPGEENGGDDAAGSRAPIFEVTYWTWIPPVPFEGGGALGGPGVAEVEGGPGRTDATADEREPAGYEAAAPARESGDGGGVGGRALEVGFGFRFDPLSAVMVLIVTGVGFLIHVYSTGYMTHDPGYARYFAYLNLFTAMMLTLVLANNFLVMFVGWEGVGLCSYLLIGFWYEDPEKAQAGRKAFIVNRIGDFAFVLAMVAILFSFHTLHFGDVMDGVASGAAPAAVLTTIALALFAGACGKSAQIPLFVWLSDAMAGPTPVSALIHAATMVTAGVYMVARCSPLFVAAPGALTVVAVVGATTALFAATIALVQNDIKKVLAYSTVSQLGYMFLGAGVGAFAGSIFHLMTHAFFKALLFLGAGSVIHAMSNEQDLRKMGGLKAKLPRTYGTMLVGALAIAGFPGLSGFFSKDEILWRAWETGHPLLWAIGAAVAGLTAFYMFRLVFMAFHGRFRGTVAQENHLHESPPSMVVPLVVLAILSVVGGWIGIPHSLGRLVGIPNGLERYLEPVLASAPSPHEAGAASAELVSPAAHAVDPAEYALMLLAVAIAIGGILLARRFYVPLGDLPARAARAAGPVYGLVANRYWVDELYDATVLKAYYRTAAIFDSFDRWVVDGLVNAVAAFTEMIGQILRLFQTGFVRNYALMVFIGAVLLVWMLGR